MRALVIAWFVGAACASGASAPRAEDPAPRTRSVDVVLRVDRPLGSFEIDLAPAEDTQLLRLERGDPPFDGAGFVDMRALEDGSLRLIGFHATDARPTGEIRVARIWTDTDPADWNGIGARVYDPDGAEISAELILIADGR